MNGCLLGEAEFSKTLRPLLGGKTVMVLGSAPTVRIPSDYSNEWTLVCVNASAATARTHALKIPDLTVLALGGLRRQNTADRAMRDGIYGLETRSTIVRSNKTGWLKNAVLQATLARRLRKLSFSYGRLLYAAPKDWTPALSILGADTNQATNISTGVFACLMTLYFGAEKLVVAGIDPQSTGHAHNAANLPRQHAIADAKAMALLARMPGVAICGRAE